MVTVVKSEAQQQAFCPHINKENLLTSFLLISADQLGNNLANLKIFQLSAKVLILLFCVFTGLMRMKSCP